jgi:hypothetical protein
MNEPRRHPFDGEMLTVFEIHARIPALSIETIRRRIKLGQTTSREMLNWTPPKQRPTKRQQFTILPPHLAWRSRAGQAG